MRALSSGNDHFTLSPHGATLTAPTRYLGGGPRNGKCGGPGSADETNRFDRVKTLAVNFERVL